MLSPRRLALPWGALIASAFSAGTALAQAQQAYVQGTPYQVVESGHRFNRLQDALYEIAGGTGTIRIAPGVWKDCGVQTAGNVTFTAEIPGRTIFTEHYCEGKGALVLRGRSSRVVGLVFAGLRVSDGNAAGIRLEKGNLSVSQSWFRDSDEGILGNNDPTGTASIDKSTFSHLGRCSPDISCAHSIYINFYDRVTVTRSRFEAGTGGHYLKVRAGNVLVTDNLFDDTAGRATNYMIDLPAGATGRIANNMFIQGGHKENGTALIAVAAESHTHSANGLTIENNLARFAPGAERQTAWVADWSGDRLAIGANQIAPGMERYQRR